MRINHHQCYLSGITVHLNRNDKLLPHGPRKRGYNERSVACNVHEIFQILNFLWAAGNSKSHIPDIAQEKCFIDLLVVCSFGVLINVLCHRTYTAPGLDCSSPMNDMEVRLWNQYDVNGLDEDDRKLLCLARGRSIELISWLSMTYATGIPDKPVRTLFFIILVDICKMLCDYKWRADKMKIDCPPDFTIQRLKTQIHAALALVVRKIPVPPATLEQLNWDPRRWKLPMDPRTSSSILPHIEGMNIHKSSAPSYQRATQTELFEMGETTLDRKFAERLEVKREIIGMYWNNFTVLFTPHVGFLRRTHSDETEVTCVQL